MKAGRDFFVLRFWRIALSMAAVTALGASAASAQSSRNQDAVTDLKSDAPIKRAVGVEGRLKSAFWTTGSERDLFDMRLMKETRRLARAPDAMKNTRVWIARADVSELPGEEILMQIRSPLTCGSLGCELLVISEATGDPRVLLRTIGDTIDAPAMDELVVNKGSSRQRSWKYSREQFQPFDDR